MSAVRMIAEIERLSEARGAVDRFRSLILDLAVRGRLVAQKPADEPSATLLDHADHQRASLSTGAIGLRATKHEPPFPARLPAGWSWATMARCFHVSGGIQKQPKRTPQRNAFPYVGVANVQRGRLDLTSVAKFELFANELERLRLQPGDLLIVEGNGSANEIGRCARWNGEIADCVHQNHIIRCRPLVAGIEAFTLMYLNSPSGVNTMKALAVTSAGLYNLSVGKIQRITIPLPPLAEQIRIVAKVDELMAVLNDLDAAQMRRDATRDRLLESVMAAVMPSNQTVSPR